MSALRLIVSRCSLLKQESLANSGETSKLKKKKKVVKRNKVTSCSTGTYL